jgi:crotonobetainyl-CoA:carnitine CoA-transferase CaiB-like acyl-CoA transferase
MNGQRLPVRENPPHSGEHTEQILQELGYLPQEINQYLSNGIIGVQ